MFADFVIVFVVVVRQACKYILVRDVTEMILEGKNVK